MFLYNVTVGVDKEIANEWLHWMKTEHIPDVLNTGMFSSAHIYKILHETDEGTLSFSVQYFAETIGAVEAYLEKHAPRLREESNAKFPNRFAAFRTLLEEV